MNKLILIILFIPILFFSCEDYIGDTNTDQSNNPDNSKITPNALLAGAINNYVRHQNTTLADYGNKIAYAWGINNGFTTSDAAYNYVYTSGDYNSLFENTFLFADNFQDIVDKKSKFPNYEYHFGVAKIFKVMCMDYATALYGDVPYTEAFKGLENPYPKYDDDKTIIPKLFAELDEAKGYFATTNADVINLGSEDIVFHGDITLWTQFLHTVELRLLLRLSKTIDASLVTLRTNRASIINATQDFINQDVTVNPGYLYQGTLAQRSPIFRIYGRTEDFSAFTNSYQANAIGEFLSKVLYGTTSVSSTLTTGIVDPRRLRIASGSTFNTQGTFPSAPVSRVATFYTGRNKFASDPAEAADQNGSERDAYLMLNAESQFLQSEAMQRGYISGSAQAAFNAGITASFDFYNRGWGTLSIGLAQVSPNSTSYITSTNLKNGLGWSGSADKINAIITQKYIALANWQGMELYLDHLRTGYPALPLPVGVPRSVRPNRLIYPNSEYSSNSQNVPNVINDDLFSVNSKTPYYLQ